MELTRSTPWRGYRSETVDGSLTAVTVAVRVRHHRCVEALQSSEVEEVARGLPVGLTRSKLDLRTVAAKPVGVGGMEVARMEKGESQSQ